MRSRVSFASDIITYGMDEDIQYGVATVSRIDKIKGLFCKRGL